LAAQAWVLNPASSCQKIKTLFTIEEPCAALAHAILELTAAGALASGIVICCSENGNIARDLVAQDKLS